MIRRIIRTDGTQTDLPNPVSTTEIRRLIGAETLDTVTLKHMGEPLHVMCVNDDGWDYEVVKHEENGCRWIEARPTTPRLPINEAATALYLRNCVPGTTHQIVGDVVIAPDSDFAR